MSGVTLHPVDSSMMSHIGYDQGSKTLTILFNSGKRYDYAAVPQEVYDRFLASSSQGSFFRNEIDQYYSYRQVKGPR
ncbi:KTSC domain-containing protein [Deinococcus arenicola]|uniref:KTSC domain-containing protein n=1 Tax=Deinococcus arenicola TaxID=2994950 RepID=A0ABU4DPM3_9DEIO|nr:KTSC domain-containing protein [Deinococcus sp. ZS9-10]MDV6374381.1 KTSC domain-containing protein [Deinococcus sp. ZS9-10]